MVSTLDFESSDPSSNPCLYICPNAVRTSDSSMASCWGWGRTAQTWSGISVTCSTPGPMISPGKLTRLDSFGCPSVEGYIAYISLRWSSTFWIVIIVICLLDRRSPVRSRARTCFLRGLTARISGFHLGGLGLTFDLLLLNIEESVLGNLQNFY